MTSGWQYGAAAGSLEDPVAGLEQIFGEQRVRPDAEREAELVAVEVGERARLRQDEIRDPPFAGHDFLDAFASVDFIVTPTAPTVAFKLGEKTSDPLAMYLNDYCTVPMSLAGIPAISIPCGLSDGLPVGMQIAGPAFSENRLFDVAHALERALAFDGASARV